LTALILPGATAQPQTLTQADSLPATFGGIKPPILQMFWSMQQGLDTKGAPKYTAFPTQLADGLWNRGQLYLHTWGPWDWVGKQVWTPSDILAGKYDAYWAAQAAAIKGWKHPCFIRLMHEFNGSWEPWSFAPADFVNVWHHVVDLFRQVGASNVTWVWCPNQLAAAGSASSTAADKLAAYVPDPADFHWTAFDAYNRGTQSFRQICDLTYATIAGLVPDKPMMIPEYGCTSTVDQATWITDALATIPKAYPLVRAACYYSVDVKDGYIWALAPAAAATYAAGIKAGPYALPLPSMPPDMQPIKPLQSAQWGDSDADLAKQLALLDQANVTLSGQNAQLSADLGLANVGLDQAAATINRQEALLTQAGTQHDADAAAIDALNQSVLERGVLMKAWQKATADLANVDTG
jgi:hypothetical protein